MKQDKVEKSMVLYPVNPACAYGIHPVKKLFRIKSIGKE